MVKRARPRPVGMTGWGVGGVTELREGVIRQERFDCLSKETLLTTVATENQQVYTPLNSTFQCYRRRAVSYV